MLLQAWRPSLRCGAGDLRRKSRHKCFSTAGSARRGDVRPRRRRVAGILRGCNTIMTFLLRVVHYMADQLRSFGGASRVKARCGPFVNVFITIILSASKRRMGTCNCCCGRRWNCGCTACQKCFSYHLPNSSSHEVETAFGAKVIAAAGSDSKIEIAKRYGGADHGVNYSKPGWQKEVLSITGGKGVNVIYDPVGLIQGTLAANAQFILSDHILFLQDSLKCIAWKGRALVVGFAAGTIEKVVHFDIIDPFGYRWL